VGIATVERVRKRLVAEGLEAALRERPRPGGYRKLDDKQEAFLIALACSTPPEERTCWTMQLLAGKQVELRVVDAISDETVQGKGVGIRDYGSMTFPNLFSSHGILAVSLD
jgi:hypothetical protein